MVPFSDSSPHHCPMRPNVSLRFSSESVSQKPVSSAISMTYFMSSSLWPDSALFDYPTNGQGLKSTDWGLSSVVAWATMASPMNLLDLGIVVVIGLGILIGWKKGLIGPLLAEGTFLFSYWIVST